MRTSHLETSGSRFLSSCLKYALDEHWLSPADLNQEFSAAQLMSALEGTSELRARLLIEAAGVHEKIARKKSTGAAAEDLQIALDEGVCTPSTILEIVSVEEHVRHLDAGRLWDLLTRDQFWFQTGPRPQARMLAMIRSALDEKLLDLHRLVKGVTPEQLSADLPRELIESALSTAIHAGLDGAAFEPETLLETLSLESWLEHLPLSHFWDHVILAEILPGAGLLTVAPKVAEKASNKTKEPPTAEKPAELTLEPTKAADPSDAEQIARQRAINNLAAIDRLPKDSESLRSPVLLGLDAMYEELLETEADEDRADRIRDAFPNPQMLEEALFAMAETLDPRLTKEELKTRGADSNAIIQLILFEERRRAARLAGVVSSAPPSVRPATIPPPPSSVVAPRPAGASGMPPLPPEGARRVSAPPPPLPAQARKQAR